MRIIPSPKFQKEIKRLNKKYRSIADDFAELLDSLQTDPKQGTLLRNDCYKVRMSIASKGRGKSGGARVVVCVKIVIDTIYLISIYDKSEQESIHDSELDAVLKDLGLLE